MPTSEFFSRLGLFVCSDFLDAEWCATIRAESLAVRGASASVHKSGETFSVDESVRKVKQLKFTSSALLHINSRLREIKPALEKHFKLCLSDFEQPLLLVYRARDFYRAHRDGYALEGEPGYLERRRISIVIFLNAESETPEQTTYCGGALTFYGLIKDERWKSYGFPLKGDTGLLIAFPSDIFHSVEAVTHGERYVIATWYF